MSNPYIDRLNYYSDPRVTTREPSLVVEIEDPETGEHVEHTLPTRWVICSVCDGNGTHVNPSIDAGGLSSDAFLEDPDFADDYFSGVHDVPCYCCKGTGKIREPDYDRMTPEQIEAYEEDQRSEAEYEAMCRAERIMGA